MPRRRRGSISRRRKLTPLRVVAIAGIIGVFLLVGYTGIQFLRKAVKPVGLLWTEKSEVNRMEKDYTAKNREVSELEAKRRYLKSPAGTEAEARKLGYVRPGEVSIMLEDQAKKKRKPSALQP